MPTNAPPTRVSTEDHVLTESTAIGVLVQQGTLESTVERVSVRQIITLLLISFFIQMPTNALLTCFSTEDHVLTESTATRVLVQQGTLESTVERASLWQINNLF